MHGSNSATEYQQVVTANGRERAQRQLQLGQKHAHGEGSAFFVYPQCSILLSDTNARTAQSEMQNETLLDDSDL